MHKIHRDLEEQLQINAQLLADNSQRQIDMQAKESEIAALKVLAGGTRSTHCAHQQVETARVGKMRDAVQSKLLVAEAQRSTVEQQRDALKAEVHGGWRWCIICPCIICPCRFAARSCDGDQAPAAAGSQAGRSATVYASGAHASTGGVDQGT